MFRECSNRGFFLEKIMTIKLIIFDFDGVLVDSEYIAGQVVTDTLPKYGVTIPLADVLKRYVGMHDTAMRESLIEDIGEDKIDQFFEEIKATTTDRYKNELTPLPNVVEMLNSLTMPICIGSNSRLISLKAKLGYTKLDQFFKEEQLYVGSMVAKPKPAPDLYLYAAKQYGLKPSECLVIEDSVHGTNAAVAAKMPVIGYYGASHCYASYEQKLKQAGAEYLFNDMQGLNKILDSYS